MENIEKACVVLSETGAQYLFQVMLICQSYGVPHNGLGS